MRHPALDQQEREVAEVLVDEVAKEYRLDVAQIMGETRIWPVVEARHEAQRRLRDEELWSFPRIAEFFGRDTATVQYGIKQARARRNIREPERAVTVQWANARGTHKKNVYSVQHGFALLEQVIRGTRTKWARLEWKR